MTPEVASGVGPNPASGIGDRAIVITNPTFFTPPPCLQPPIKCCSVVWSITTGFEPELEKEGGHELTSFSVAVQAETLSSGKLPVISGSNPLSTIGMQSPPLNQTIFQQLFFTAARHSYVAGMVSDPFYTTYPPIIPANLDYQEVI